MNKTYLTTIIASLALGSCIAAQSTISHAASSNIAYASEVDGHSFTAVGILATQATCQLNSIETKVINIPGFKSRTACEKFLIPNAHTKDFLGTDGEICRINYNFDGLCVNMND